MAGTAPGRRLTRFWPWALLVLATLPAAWHVVDFEEEPDPEFPRVERPTFSRRPPPAYRLAEPGDTIDHLGLYASAGAIVLSASGWWLSRRPALWPTSLGLSIASAWYAANPGPTFDGWHGLGWRAVLDPAAPPRLRAALAGSAALLAAWSAAWALAARRRWPGLAAGGRASGALALAIVAIALVGARQVDLPGVEPAGYWPRWGFFWGMLAFDLALVRSLPPLPARWTSRAAGLAACGAAWLAMVAGGIALTSYHRPIRRLKAAVPGRIFISAMPDRRGLAIAHERHHFKTIINLFPEDAPGLRSPKLAEEMDFAREHGIRYVRSPLGVTGADAFLDRTLALAQDPDAWPILVHCHACMDRTPAWLGIYRFVVEGWPLDAVLREIEQHRGYRPKASVTVLFNRVLPPRAPARYAADSTAALLRRCAAGTADPFEDQLRAEAAGTNPPAVPRVSRRDGPGGPSRRP